MMYQDAITDAANIGARHAIEWKIRGHANTGVDVYPIIQPTWQTSLVEKISSYRSLPQNWNSYGSPPPSPAAIQGAIWFITSMLDEKKPRPRVTPVSGGGIQFEWAFGERQIEIEFLRDGTIADTKANDETPGRFDRPSRIDIGRLLSWLIDS
jgi:hypothetical protein